MTASKKQEFISQIKQRYELIKSYLSERERRVWAASESIAIGHGGDVIVQEATGISRGTIRKGRKEIKNKDPETTERIRRPGGGRKSLIEKHPKLVKALEGLIYPFSRDGGKSPALRWTRKSTAMLTKELNELKIKISKKKELTVSQKTVYSMMKALGYSMYTNKKNVPKKLNNYMDIQFHSIYEEVKKYQKSGYPVISIDLMKNINLNGLNDVSDVSKDEKWEKVGIEDDTALFAVETIQKWWDEMGHFSYPDMPGLLITIDGAKNKVWSQGLQKFSDTFGIKIQICQFPPGIRKWNKIEHQISSSVIKNRSGQPLQGFCAIVSLIANTLGKGDVTQANPFDYDHANDLKNNELAKWNDLITPRVNKDI